MEILWKSDTVLPEQITQIGNGLKELGSHLPVCGHLWERGQDAVVQGIYGPCSYPEHVLPCQMRHRPQAVAF
ncbi:hypothetical protein M404DRAFT_996769 [Pisolithus tinctorius Marx 270]|uniref:Uncharacterized protein n=1 Tax=Pisolithus tinctorius Marx 270 TaxID=870435 RepID=A0A0C3KHH9_PISTI|nr:hypothetical protein M404DRAFT_996769 [Pisolithus tinctorius Marx 270]